MVVMVKWFHKTKIYLAVSSLAVLRQSLLLHLGSFLRGKFVKGACWLPGNFGGNLLALQLLLDALVLRARRRLKVSAPRPLHCTLTPNKTLDFNSLSDIVLVVRGVASQRG